MPTAILGPAQVALDQAIDWAVQRGAIDPGLAELAAAYWWFAAHGQPVRPDVALAQAMKETGFLRFGGTDAQFSAKASMHNPAGMKTVDGAATASFSSWTTGALAHMDHLALYAGAPGYPKPGSPDPRPFTIVQGAATTVEGLGGHWAPDPGYGVSVITDYLNPMLVHQGAPVTISRLAAVFIQGDMDHTSGKQTAVNRIVIHGTVSPTVRGGARAVAQYFTQANAGGLAHYVVDPGEIVACAQENIVCWHAPPNEDSIGIELCDPVTGGPARWDDADHQAMIADTAALAVDLAARWNVPLVRLGAADLVAGKRGICGHVDVSAAWHQTNHTDPGPDFPWDQFMGLVTGVAPAPPAPPVPLPPPVTLEVDVQLARNSISMKLDNTGKGWTMIPVPFDHLVSVLMNGADPRVSGYVPVPVPSEDAQGTQTQIECVGGPPNGEVTVFYWAAV